MKHEEKINYMRIAAMVAGFGFDNKQLDTLISLYELVLTKKGSTDMKDIVMVESEVKKRADGKMESELIDEVNQEVNK